MKKIILILIIVLVASVVAVGSVFAYDNKYLWIPISEESLRQKVSEFFYFEINYESCELNNYIDFNSREDCQNGIRCISDKFSNIIPKEDLRRLVDSMKEGENAESAVISYFEQHTEIEVRYMEDIKDCLMWVAQ